MRVSQRCCDLGVICSPPPDSWRPCPQRFIVPLLPAPSATPPGLAAALRVRGEVEPLLEKYRDWFEDSIVRDERSGDPPSRFAAYRLEGLAMTKWMLEGVSDRALYAQSLRLQEQTVSAEAAAKQISLEATWAADAGPYLRTWIMAGDPAQGAATARDLAPDDDESSVALRLCRADWGHAPPDGEALAAGEAMLTNHLADDCWSCLRPCGSRRSTSSAD